MRENPSFEEGSLKNQFTAGLKNEGLWLNISKAIYEYHFRILNDHSNYQLILVTFPLFLAILSRAVCDVLYKMNLFKISLVKLKNSRNDTILFRHFEI